MGNEPQGHEVGTRGVQGVGPLEDVRVVDLTGNPGAYCCKLLGDLGADVIRVEKPGGDECRWQPPYYHGVETPDTSLAFFARNTSKRSITLDLQARESAAILARLVRWADVLVESYSPGFLDELGIGYGALSTVNPGLVMASITPFGQTGPYRGFRSTDLTAQAMGGLMSRVGYPEDPPCRVGGEQVYLLASVQAAIGILLGLEQRDLAGRGQHVDVSMHESVAQVDMYALATVHLGGEVLGRRGLYHSVGAAGIWQCKDGWVRYHPAGDRQGGGWDQLIDWMGQQGAAQDLLDPQYQDVEVRFAAIEHIVEVVTAFFKLHAKAELTDEGQRRGIMIYPTNDMADLLADPQLVNEGFFVPVAHPELGAKLIYAGHPYRLSQTPWRIQKRPPLLGEHNREIYQGELGFSEAELDSLRKSGVI